MFNGVNKTKTVDLSFSWKLLAKKEKRNEIEKGMQMELLLPMGILNKKSEKKKKEFLNMLGGRSLCWSS